MARTVYGVGDPSAVKRYSAVLFQDVARDGWWTSRLARKGRDAEVPVQILTELEKDAGDTISFDLFAQKRNRATFGDDRIKGKEEAMQKFTDSVEIDQVRSSTSAGGRMTRKRVLHDLRLVARKLEADWWTRWKDEALNCYAAGARGMNEDFIEDVDWTGFANNAFQAPDADHQLYGGSATAKNNLTNADGITLALIDKLVAKAKTFGGGTTRKPRIRPIRVDGENHFIFTMSPQDEKTLRSNTSTGQWLDIQKAAATAQGTKNPIFRGGLGMYNNVVLQVNDGLVRFDDYGAGSNLPASRCLFMGMQAMVAAYGSPGDGLRMDWHEEMDDRGNELTITTSCIWGAKKNRLMNQDYGIFSVDVYSPE